MDSDVPWLDHTGTTTETTIRQVLIGTKHTEVKMIYVVNADIEVEAATPEIAGDMVLNMLEDANDDVFASILEVKEIEQN